MEHTAPPSWAEGDPQILAEQFVKITGDSIREYPTKFFALVTATAAASLHNVLVTSPAHSRQQQIENIQATAAAVVQAFRAKPSRGQNAGTQGTPAPLKNLNKVIQTLQQQLQQQQDPHLVTAAFEAYLKSLADISDPADQFDDGSNEAFFIGVWPLDGSAAAGADLKEDGTWRVFRQLQNQAPPNLMAAVMGAAGFGRFKAQMAQSISKRDPPVPNSSPLAMFIDSKPQAMYSSRAAQAAAEAAEAAAAAAQAAAATAAAAAGLPAAAAAAPVPAAGAAGAAAAPTGAEPGGNSKRLKRSRVDAAADPAAGAGTAAGAAAAAAAAGTGAAAVGAGMRQQLRSPLTYACCDIKVLDGVASEGNVVHIDGDLLCLAFRADYRRRDPGFGGAVLRYVPRPPGSQQQQRASSGWTPWTAPGQDPEWGLTAISDYGLEVEESIDWHCVNVRHGLFSHVSRVCADAGNGLMWCAGDNGRRIKAFRAPAEQGGPAVPQHRGAACNRGEGNGMQLQYTLRSEWGCAGLHVVGTRVMAITETGNLLSWELADLPPQARERQSSRAFAESGEDSDEGSDGEGPIFRGHLDDRDMDFVKVECSKGVPPTHTQQLQLPTTASVKGKLGLTCLAGPSCSTLAASWEGVSPSRVTHRMIPSLGVTYPSSEQASAVLTFDMHTQRATNTFIGHLYEVTDIAAAPAAWAGAEQLFATAANGCDVKIWDMRCRGGAAAITLSTGHGGSRVGAVVLANDSGSSNSGGSSSSSQLGAGMVCFAGGECESVWAWDVRASSAQALYQLSTGNQEVTSLAWHAASNTLIANCWARHDWGSCEIFDARPAGYVDAADYEVYNPYDDDFVWPKAAKHEPIDFRQYYAVCRSNVLAYTFSDGASQVVPDVEGCW